MKRLRRTVACFLLAVLLWCSCVVSPVHAVQQAYVLDTLAEPYAAVPSVAVSYVAVPTLAAQEYMDADTAAVRLREQMQRRTDVITVSVRSEESDGVALFQHIMDQALTHSGEPTGGDYLYWHRDGYGGSVSSYALSDTYYYTLNYEVRYYTTARQEQELDSAVDALLEELDLWEASDYEKVLGIYDYMTRNISYDYDTLYDADYKLKYSAYAALVNKTAVCQGYANLFYRLALELDVDCRLIPGFGNGGAHAWNIVKLGRLYYDLDATWDASRTQAGADYRYFLRCEDTFGDHTRDEAYDTPAFHRIYPMGTRDYDPTAQPEHVCGDANGDGSVDGMDATVLLQYAAGWEVGLDLDSADVNGDGTVDGMDATLLLQYAAGWDVSLAG